MPRSGSRPRALATTSNFAYMRKLQQPPLAADTGTPITEIVSLELGYSFAGVRTEFQDLDGVKPVFHVDSADASASRPRTLSFSNILPSAPASSFSADFGVLQSPPSEAEDEDDDEDTIRPKRRGRMLSSATSIFPAGGDCATVRGRPVTKDAQKSARRAGDAPRRHGGEDAQAVERPPSRCGFWDDADDGDVPPTPYVGGAALARHG